jgi:hypothetical protein
VICAVLAEWPSRQGPAASSLMGMMDSCLSMVVDGLHDMHPKQTSNQNEQCNP